MKFELSRKRASATLAFLFVFTALNFVNASTSEAGEASLPYTLVTWDDKTMTKPTGYNCKNLKFNYVNIPGKVSSTKIDLLNGNGEILGGAYASGTTGIAQVLVCGGMDFTSPLSVSVTSSSMPRWEGNTFIGISDNVVDAPFKWYSKTKTITCVKSSNKSVTKKVTGTNPKCPTGYKLK